MAVGANVASAVGVGAAGGLDVGVGRAACSPVCSDTGDGCGVGVGAGEAVEFCEIACWVVCRSESRSPVPESDDRNPKAYNPPATAPTIMRANNISSNVEGPVYFGCLSAMHRDYNPKNNLEFNIGDRTEAGTVAHNREETMAPYLGAGRRP